MNLDLRKCPNHKMHESESAEALLEVRNHFRKQFSHKGLSITIPIFFWGGSVLVRIEKVKKNNVFPKMDLDDVGGNFHI